MFSIGEFSRFAQVTAELLRHYDRLDLFKPAYTDSHTSYRYYTIDQLPELNRILALKELGLSLEQVRRLLHDRVSLEEMRGMLTLQKLKAEEAIRAEVQRLQRIESRLHYLENNGSMPHHEVVTKSTSEETWLSIPRQAYPDLSGSQFFYDTYQAFARQYQAERCICSIHALELETDNWDMGFIIKGNMPDTLALSLTHQLSIGILPGYDTVATILFNGSMAGLYQAYNALGQWIETHQLAVVGVTYEVFYHIDPEDGSHTAEIQMPLREVST
jgi:DNA-binding transcriptional MerR regulator